MFEFLRISHRWLGLALALPLLIQGATGFVLAITPPFEEARLPRAAPTQAAPRSIAAIVAAATAAGTPGLTPNRYFASPEPGAAATVELGRPGRRGVEARVFVDPATLVILGLRDHPDGFYRWVHGLHEFLLMPTPFGHALIGWWGGGLFVLGVTGIPIWWPRRGRWKAAFTVPPSARGYRLWRAIHGAIGGFVGLFLIAQSFSGASMAFPRTFGAVLGLPPGGQGVPGGKVRPAADPAAFDPDRVANLARASVPDAKLISLRYPNEPGRPALVAFSAQGDREGAPPALVFVDPAGTVMAVRDPRTAVWGASALGWLRAVHAGDGMGPAWRVIVCLGGVALPVFPVTGLAMYLSRRRQRRRSVADRTVLQGVSE